MNKISIYPEFFKTGIDRLQRLGARNGDFLGLFSALGHFRRDLSDHSDAKSILQAVELYVFGLDLFETIGFFLVNPSNFDFELSHSAPESEAAFLQELVHHEMRAGRFAWALRQGTPTFFDHQAPKRTVTCVFHTLGVSTQRLGMFCGILKQDRMKSQEVTLSLLSILLGACSDALGRLQTTQDLRNQVLAANSDLQRALKENEALARFPEESPNPVFRLGNSGRVLYSNQTGGKVLSSLGCGVGDFISGAWMETLSQAFASGAKCEFEATFGGNVYSFMVVPVTEEGYANFYGTDITARKSAETERERLIGELREALASVKTLSGLVPICAWCKKIRDDRGFWKDVEVFVQSHSDATFSHGVCPECRTKWFEKRVGEPLPPPAR